MYWISYLKRQFTPLWLPRDHPPTPFFWIYQNKCDFMNKYSLDLFMSLTCNLSVIFCFQPCYWRDGFCWLERHYHNSSPPYCRSFPSISLSTEPTTGSSSEAHETDVGQAAQPDQLCEHLCGVGITGSVSLVTHGFSWIGWALLRAEELSCC